MAKLVEYPPPPTPERTLEERWYAYGQFWFDQFTHSELSVSGFHNLLFDDELEDDKFEEVYAHGGEVQQLVLRAFNNRASGAFRVLWNEGNDWPVDVRETALLRFPREIALEVQEIFALLDIARDQEDRDEMFEEYVQCVAMLHAYTGLPNGELSKEDQMAQERILRGGAAGEAVTRIMRGPWLSPQTTSGRKQE